MATIKILQRTKPLSNGLLPIYLRVTKDRKHKYISLNLACEKTEWNTNKSEFRKNYSNYKQLNQSLINIKNRAESIIAKLLADGKDFSLIEFKELFFEYKTANDVKVLETFDEYIEELTVSNRLGNARYYLDTKRSLRKFLNDNDIPFNELNPAMLKKYEVYLRANDNSDSGISAKMRAVRAVFNDAIKKKYTKSEFYPFDTYKISKFKKTNNKRALSLEQIQKIVDFNTSDYPNLLNTKNYFLFSYYTRGMNFYDMMMLTWDNIKGSKIHYTRRKTKTSFTIQILQPVQSILDYYKSQARPTKYVFPILLRNDMRPKQIEYRKIKVLKQYNKQLKEIAELCEIAEKITSYVARHSFATHLKQKGVSTDIISEAMGHQNLAITQAYLKDLESSVIDDAMEKLLE